MSSASSQYRDLYSQVVLLKSFLGGQIEARDVAKRWTGVNGTCRLIRVSECRKKRGVKGDSSEREIYTWCGNSLEYMGYLLYFGSLEC